VVNASSVAKVRKLTIAGNKKASNGTVTFLQNDRLDAVNSFEEATHMVPQVQELTIKNNSLAMELKPYSFMLIRVPIGN